MRSFAGIPAQAGSPHRSRRASTSATKESILHLLMMAEGGIMVLVGLFLEMNAGVLAIMTAAAAMHEATVVRDFRYASDKRPTGPMEQHTHSFLEVAPLSLLAFAATTHWDQFGALFGRGEQRGTAAMLDCGAPWRERHSHTGVFARSYGICRLIHAWAFVPRALS